MGNGENCRTKVTWQEDLAFLIWRERIPALDDLWRRSGERIARTDPEDRTPEDVASGPAGVYLSRVTAPVPMS